jgi:hypothetical protein
LATEERSNSRFTSPAGRQALFFLTIFHAQKLLLCNFFIAANSVGIASVDAALFDTTLLDTTLPNIGLLDTAVF